MWIRCVRFIDFTLKGKSFHDYTNLFSPNDCEKNDKIIVKYFKYLRKEEKYLKK